MRFGLPETTTLGGESPPISPGCTVSGTDDSVAAQAVLPELRSQKRGYLFSIRLSILMIRGRGFPAARPITSSSPLAAKTGTRLLPPSWWACLPGLSP
jgi:hypothetical protein